MKISAVVLTRKSEDLIKDCLASLAWVDEVIVVDDGSTDKTRQIAKEAGCKVFTFSGNFSEKRNFAAKKAVGEFLLYIDHDERVTPLLRKEIQSLITNHQSMFSAYAIPRKNIILGRKMRWGGWWPDYAKRLFYKRKFAGWKGELHEEPIFEGKLGHIKNPLIHLKHDNFKDMVDKTNEWSEIEARLMFEANHPPINVLRFFSAAAREFYLRMIRHSAFLDGPKGIIYALYQVYSRLASYAKLWEMQLKAKK